MLVRGTKDKEHAMAEALKNSIAFVGIDIGKNAAALFTHECMVSVDLAGKSRPARGEISQNLGFSFTLR